MKFVKLFYNFKLNKTGHTTAEMIVTPKKWYYWYLWTKALIKSFYKLVAK